MENISREGAQALINYFDTIASARRLTDEELAEKILASPLWARSLALSEEQSLLTECINRLLGGVIPARWEGDDSQPGTNVLERLLRFYHRADYDAFSAMLKEVIAAPLTEDYCREKFAVWRGDGFGVFITQLSLNSLAKLESYLNNVEM